MLWQVQALGLGLGLEREPGAVLWVSQWGEGARKWGESGGVG